MVRAAFIPFGEIINIEIPPDYENHEKHRGFAFIEYELAEDAAAAIDNMVIIFIVFKYKSFPQWCSYMP